VGLQPRRGGTTIGQPDLAAFRLFLLGHKKRVTRVTRVTTSKSNDLACYAEAGGRVTGVTAREPDSAPEEAEAVERQAIAETEGGVPPLYSAAFAKLQLNASTRAVGLPMAPIN